MEREERREEQGDEEWTDQDRLEPAATDEERARAAQEAVEEEEHAEEAQGRDLIEDERPWVPAPKQEEPSTDAEASEADAVEQSKPP